MRRQALYNRLRKRVGCEVENAKGSHRKIYNPDTGGKIQTVGGHKRNNYLHYKRIKWILKGLNFGENEYQRFFDSL